MGVDEVSGAAVDAAMKVPTVPGAGLLESAHGARLTHERRERRHSVCVRVVLPLDDDNGDPHLKDRIKRLAHRL